MRPHVKEKNVVFLNFNRGKVRLVSVKVWKIKFSKDKLIKLTYQK